MSLLRLFLNPKTFMLVLAFAGGAWFYSRVLAAEEQQALAAEAHHAQAVKTGIEAYAKSQREKDNARIEMLKEELAKAQAAISLYVDAPCSWSPIERRLFNDSQAPGAGKADK